MNVKIKSAGPDLTGLKIESQLQLERCPHCKVDRPTLNLAWKHSTTDYRGHGAGMWATYVCVRCGHVVLANAIADGHEIRRIYPQPEQFDETIPERARHYLKDASNSAPSGAVVVAAAAIDAMLKSKGYGDTDGKLYHRIDKAAADHLITEEMRLWAHDVRLDANEQRHADEDAELPTADDARRCIDFAKALGEFLFVLPSRVRRGREDAKGVKDTATVGATEQIGVEPLKS